VALGSVGMRGQGINDREVVRVFMQQCLAEHRRA
jgi:hypothetical protein